MGLYRTKGAVINPSQRKGSSAFDIKYSTQQIYAPCNAGGALTGVGINLGGIFFYMSAFLQPSAGTITRINWSGIGNAGNSGATETIEWLVLEVADSKVSNIIASGTHDHPNTDNSTVSTGALDISVPEQFFVGIIADSGDLWDIDSFEKTSYPGIPAANATVPSSYAQVTAVSGNPPSVDDIIAWSTSSIAQTVTWKP